MKRKRRRRFLVDPSSVACDQDKNERFVARKCGHYLERFLERYPVINDESAIMLHWILGPDIEKVAEYLAEQARDSGADAFEDEDDDYSFSWRYDDYEYADKIMGFVRKLPPKRHPGLVRFIMKVLRQRVSGLKSRAKSDVEKNMAATKHMFKLTDLEAEYCLFHFIMTAWKAPRDFFDCALECKSFAGRRYVKAILKMTTRGFNDILNGTLAKIGLIVSDSGFELNISDDFLDLFQGPSSKAISTRFFSRMTAKSIPLERHMVDREEIDHVLDLLKERPKGSTHILLYGPQGTGKTTFAHGIAQRLGLPGYEIIRGDEKNAGSKRRAAIVACLIMTNMGQGSFILVDEADNLLNTQWAWFFQGETQDKGWLNQLLETPGARMIWIVNRICRIEDSVLRRFAFSIHFKPFNRRQRTLLWGSILSQNRAKRLLAVPQIEELASQYKVSAGAIDLAVKKAKETGHTQKEGFHKAVTLALDSHRVLLNGGDKPRGKDRIEKNYSLEGINVEGDLYAMIGQLEKFDQYLRHSESKEVMNMNLLFYGPPGAGKSELARYIGERLDREVICKRMSDLQSKWVGESEQNIRDTFEQAEAEDAILIIDEADSLLFSRDRAQRSWEISFTNEFLTRMERFKGVLICTTNRLKDLDEASMRRFNHKIGFNYLKPEGNVIFYQKLLSPIIDAPVDEGVKNTLMGIVDLSPGDFKVVRDRFSFYPRKELSHQVLVQALKEESELKVIHKGRKHIGF
ncbi:MAG: ATP-binding protein [Desulfobacterales bacterium]|nr:ATP-binding protein [Desulfobacterales bacterium]